MEEEYSPVSSFISSLHNDNGGNGGASCAKPRMLGRGISEVRLGAGAIEIRCAVVQIEALPVLFGNASCSVISGLFSFSVGSIHLAMPPSVRRGHVGL
ncbi:hypothetical protein GH714_011493 [Hevea brasiliensis]|uniref:Uncharacterized protein n=1 Tax=Hevea brasiliensis TaxID=3981 RepID=A0A6A6KDG7_HEVBR|nr:hypothetical protein GH714_011493 [Hevea brasiliensis]